MPTVEEMVEAAKKALKEASDMAIVYEKSRGLTDVEFHYCPGCHHGIIHKLVAEVAGGAGSAG